MYRLWRCEPECPIDAIVPDTESSNEKWLELNTEYSENCPNIIKKKDPPKNNKEHENEEKSNQILDFTREIKNSHNEFKIKIIETLWGIIYSNKEADMYESNLMRRLAGLLYLDNKVMGDIKEKVKKKFSK